MILRDPIHGLVAFESVPQRIGGTFAAHPLHRRLRAPPHSGRPHGVARFEIREACAQTNRIEWRYGKRADAALEAAGPAGEPHAALARGFRHGGIHDLDEVAVAWHLERFWHTPPAETPQRGRMPQ